MHNFSRKSIGIFYQCLILNTGRAPIINNKKAPLITNDNYQNSMALIKWEPFSEFDRFLDDRFFPMPSSPSLTGRMGWDLAVDLYEEKGNVIARMTLPGINPDDLDISVEEETLHISGRREEEKETKNKDYYSKEIRRGSFSRSVSLPKIVDAEESKADYADGILTVTMPIVKGQEKKAVKVQIGEK